MTQIRPAQDVDAPSICALLNPIILDTTITFTTDIKTPDDIAVSIAEAKANGWTFLVSDNGEIDGVAHYFPFRKGPGYARTMEHTIYVAPSSQGSGRGRALMTELQRSAMTKGVAHLVGGISGENINGQAFHSRLGFSEVGRLTGVGFKFGRAIDLILMQKTLVTAPHNLP